METPLPRPVQPLLLTDVDELIMEILSRLPIKSLVQFRCVSKSWKSLISDPRFVKLHLHRSPKNATVLLTLLTINGEIDISFTICPKRSFLENPSSIIIPPQHDRTRIQLKNKYWVIGSCNGLVCLRGNSDGGNVCGDRWVRFWNPAINSRSKKSPRLYIDFRLNGFGSAKFGFGYDSSTDTYKVVAVLNHGTQVKVYTMGDHCWRDIQSFPAFPITIRNEGKFVSGALNWLAIRNYGPGEKWDTVTIGQLVIVSLDLGKETYKELSLPDGLDEVPKFQPALAVLMGCLCLSHDYKLTHLVVWQMKEFGVEESWTQFINVSYEHLQIKRDLWPRLQYFSMLCISENGDILMIMDYEFLETLMYNRRDNMVERIAGIPKNRIWIDANEYVPSLVPPY